MKMKKALLVLSLLIILMSLSLTVAAAQDTVVVRAIMFYSPYCQHCEYVINSVFPPLFDKYGDQLYILGIDITQEWGSALFDATVTEVGYPADQAGVPFLVVGDQILIGSEQIPNQFPAIIEQGVTADGIDWPAVSVIHDFLLAQGFINAEGQDITPTPAAEQQPADVTEEAPVAQVEDTPEPTATEAPTATPTDTPEGEDEEGFTVFDENADPSLTMTDKFNRDKIANSLAIVVLIIMVGVVVWIGAQFMRAATPRLWPDWILPVLLVIGFAIATYLATVEVTGNEAICGPVGDCNAVQQSEYATLFGFLPVAVLGMVGYGMIGAGWLTARLTQGKTQFYAKMAMFLFGIIGLIFFIYLTFLEPFVIGATCAWCLSSAVLMTLINLYTTRVALNAWADMDIDEYMDDGE